MKKPKKAATPAPLWMADKIERRPLASLVPNARNARTHSTAQVAQLAKAIQTFGWTIPVLIDGSGTIVAGHGRVLAAEKLGLTEVPVVVAPDTWTDAQKRAYVLADNKLALNSGWDQEALKIELQDLGNLHDLGELNLDLGDIGFSDADLKELAKALDAGDGRSGNRPEVEDDTKHLIVVECSGEAQQAKLFEEFQQRGLTVRMMG